MQNETVETFFHYSPNKSLAILSLLTFITFFIFFAVRLYKTNSSTFLYVIPGVALGESISFIYRIMGISKPNLARYICMYIFSIMVPLVLPLVNYMAVGQVIKHSKLPTTPFFLKPSFVSWFFFGWDMVYFWIERLGELNSSTGPHDLGVVIFIVTNIVQSMSHAAFIFITIYIHQNPNYNIKGIPNAKSRVMLCVYITFLLQYIRYIYRKAEYVLGPSADINSHEWIVYVFDTLMLVSCFVTYSVLFIGDYLPKQDVSAIDSKTNGEYIRISDLDEEDLNNMIAEGKRHVAVFNNVQKLNYSISVDP